MKNFITFLRGRGIIGFAVGFILGKATSDLIGAFVNDMVNPLVGVLTGNFSDLTKQQITIGSAAFKYGDFIVVAINFVILAAVVYLLAKVLRLERIDKSPDQK